MKKGIKALSVVLILASLIGLAAGGITLKDVLDSKAYWEAKGKESDANLASLEDGLNTLRENEAAYLEGCETYEKGLEDYKAGEKTLADGQKEYDSGVQTLKEKQAEYDAGVQSLAAAKQTLSSGQSEYDAGQASLSQAAALIQGLGDISTGYTSWHSGYQGLLSFKTSAADSGTTLPAPAADSAVIDAYDKAIDATKTSLEKGIGSYEQLDTLNAQKAELEAGIAATEASGGDATALKTQLSKVDAGISKINAALDKKPSKEQMKASLTNVNALVGVPQALADGQKSLSAGTASAVNGIMGNADMSTKLLAASGMNAEQLNATVVALPTMKYADFDSTMGTLTTLASSLVSGTDGLQAHYAAGKVKLDAAKLKLDQGYADYAAGQAKLDEGAVQLSEGKAKLEAASKELAEGKTKLEAAQKQLSEGKAKLDEFEDGRDQVIAGLETLKATETYAGLTSIADRLGADFSYMKNDTDLDIDKGLEAVAVGREFSADNGAAVTKELTTRGIASAVLLVGSLLALIAGIMGLTALVKLSGVLAIIAAVAALGALVAVLMAGSELSETAGAAFTFAPLIGCSIVAVTSVAQSVKALSAPKVTAAK